MLNKRLTLKLTESKKELNPEVVGLVNTEVNIYDLATRIEKKEPSLVAKNCATPGSRSEVRK